MANLKDLGQHLLMELLLGARISVANEAVNFGAIYLAMKRYKKMQKQIEKLSANQK